jgi:hypothetical protein
MFYAHSSHSLPPPFPITTVVGLLSSLHFTPNFLPGEDKQNHFILLYYTFNFTCANIILKTTEYCSVLCLVSCIYIYKFL